MQINSTYYFIAKDIFTKPAKWLALIMWFLISMYAVFNGYLIREAYLKEVAEIKIKQIEVRNKTLAWYDSAVKGPKDKPWIDITTPLWAHVQANNYLFKELSPTMILALGEAPYQPYYSSTARYVQAYSYDLQGEISNPDILQIGFFDFSFCWIYLMPLVLILCGYDYGAFERDRGFASLLTVNTKNLWWLHVQKLLAVAGLLLITGVIVLAFAAGLTGYFSAEWLSFMLPMIGWLILWLVTLAIIYAINFGVGLQATSMVSVWLLLCLILPAAVELQVKASKPIDYQPDVVNGMREDMYSLQKLTPDTLKKVALALYPEYAQSACATDTTGSPGCMFSMYDPVVINRVNRKFTSWVNALELRHERMLSGSWLAPVIWTQHHFNLEAGTSFTDYINYRKSLAFQIKSNSELVMRAAWSMKKVDAGQYKKVYCNK